MRRFVVYLHRRPNGEIFYVGKGLLQRAYDFAPSRRTDWHKNIVAKYGRENILVDVIECDNEAQRHLTIGLMVKEPPTPAFAFR